MSKTCTLCKCTKDSVYFYRDRRASDGHRSECKSCYRQKYYSQERDREYKKIFYRRHTAKIKSYKKKRFRDRYKSDIQFRLAHNLRSRLRNAIGKGFKTGSAVRDLGCSIEELKTHLASKFQLGMSWENYGEWHIDHIVPLCSFNLANREQLTRACNYKNLQPLWAEDNMIKGRIAIHDR